MGCIVGSCMHAGCPAPGWARLHSAGRQLIDAVIFHDAHIRGLAELVTQAPGAAAPAPRAGKQDVDDEGAERAQSRSYLSALLQVCAWTHLASTR